MYVTRTASICVYIYTYIHALPGSRPSCLALLGLLRLHVAGKNEPQNFVSEFVGHVWSLLPASILLCSGCIRLLPRQRGMG